MNKLKTDPYDNMKKYRRLKRYWKLLLKKESELSSVEYKYYPLFGQRLATSIVEEMLAYDPVLKANYMLYQELLKTMSNKDFKVLETCLTKPISPLISIYMRTSLKTLRKHLPFIENSFIYPYNNGRIEGINNKIKVLNRVAYGYRNLQNYKNRIILHFKFKPSDKQSEKKQSRFKAV